MDSLWISQNNLTNSRLVERLVRRAGIAPDDLILDIGAGGGILTEAVRSVCRAVIAIEADPHLAAALCLRFAADRRVTVMCGDMLEVPLPAEPFGVFASLPFNRTAAIVRRLVAHEPFQRGWLIVQREFAEKVAGMPRNSLLGTLIGLDFDRAIVHRFDRHDFDPLPGVDVVMLRLGKRGPPASQHLRDLIVAGYRSRRPTLDATIAALVGTKHQRALWRQVGLPTGTTPVNLSAADWHALAAAIGPHARLAGEEARLTRDQTGLARRHRTVTTHTIRRSE